MMKKNTCEGCANQAQNFAQFYANCAPCDHGSNYKEKEDKNEVEIRFIEFSLDYCAPENRDYFIERLEMLKSKRKGS